MAEQRTVNPLVVGSSPTRGARVGLLAVLALLAAAPALPQSNEPRTHLRLRGRHIYNSLTEDVTTERLTVWTDTRIGDRIQIRGVWDVGETRVHDLWAQYRANDWLRIRAGRAAPLWLPEFTEPPFAFQMVGSNPGSALTRPRETALMFLVDRGRYTGAFHLVNGTGFAPEDNDFKDVLLGVGRFLGDDWKLDLGHYEGRDGPDADVPRRQTAVHLDGSPGRDATIRAALHRSELSGAERFGGFVRVRRFLPEHRMWGALELGTETNHDDSHQSHVIAGVRYELPWTLSHVAADYRRRFGAVSDNALLVMIQWVLDFRAPRRP